MTAFAQAPRRILMTADSIGGVWTFSLDLMAALRDSGVEFALATMGKPLTPNQHAAVDRLDHVRLYESVFKLEWMEEPWQDVERAGDWLLEIAKEFQPDLIHLNGYAHAALPWGRPVLVAAHSCVYSWFHAVKGMPPGETWKTYHQKVCLGLTAASLVTAPTESMLRSLNIHYTGTINSERTIPNGRPSDLFCTRRKEQFVLTAGRLWDEAKNVRVLGEAAANLPWPIVAAGENEHPNGGRASHSHLQYLGFQSPEAFARHLSHAPIYALPARYEPFGLSALEAAFSGCALVLGDIPSLREVWEDAAVFVSPNDPRAWAVSLQKLIRDPHLRTVLGQCASQRAQSFTAERMAAGYLDAYRSMLTT